MANTHSKLKISDSDQAFMYKIYRRGIDEQKALKTVREFFPIYSKEQILDAIANEQRKIDERVSQNTIVNKQHEKLKSERIKENKRNDRIQFIKERCKSKLTQADKQKYICECISLGLSKAETSRLTGISKPTVNKYAGTKKGA